MQLVQVIGAGMDIDGDGAADLDPSRVYYIGASLSAQHGTLLLAVEPDVSAGVLNTVGGSGTELRRLRAATISTGTEGGRQGLGAELAARAPSLLNTPGITKLGGLSIAANYFNENIPLWDDNPFMPDENDDPLMVNLTDGTTNVVIQSPVTNIVPGAMEIQQLFENQEWVYQAGSPVAYAPYLQKDPLPGVPAKSVIIQFAKGDQSIANPTTAAFLRAGDLADVATFYRHDLVFADNPSLPQTLWNPHTFMGAITNAIMKPIALAAQQQMAAFFATDGAEIIQPPGVPEEYFELLTKESPLPEGLNYIVAVPPPAPVAPRQPPAAGRTTCRSCPTLASVTGAAPSTCGSPTGRGAYSSARSERRPSGTPSWANKAPLLAVSMTA